jgi:hypothetical protein
MTSSSAAKTLFAAVLLGGDTLERLVKFAKELPGESLRAISKKLQEMIAHLDGWAGPLNGFIS